LEGILERIVYFSEKNDFTVAEDVGRKLEVCNTGSIKPLASNQIDRVINTVAHLEDLESVNELGDMLA
jgi:hypothetical protein